MISKPLLRLFILQLQSIILMLGVATSDARTTSTEMEAANEYLLQGVTQLEKEWDRRKPAKRKVSK